MHRRAFIVGAGALAAAAPLAAKAQAANAGQVVTVKGYLKRITTHMYFISPTAQNTDPKSTRYADWPAAGIRVYPKEAGKLTLGLVTIKGVATAGNQQDAPTKTVARMTLTDAVMN
jgi:hypothetical protein